MQYEAGKVAKVFQEAQAATSGEYRPDSQAKAVGPTEFRAMLSALGLQAKPHESDAVFGMLDDNGSRVLDFKELQNALRLAKQAAALGGQARGQERTRRPSKLTVEVGDGRGSPVAEQPSKPPPKPPSRPPPHKPNQRLKDAGQAAVSAVRDRVAANQGAARGRAGRLNTR